MKPGDLIKITDYYNSFRVDGTHTRTFVKEAAPMCLVLSVDKWSIRFLTSWSGEILITDLLHGTNWFELVAEA